MDKAGDQIAVTNRRFWEKMVREGCGYTIPWLDLDISLLRRYAEGKLKCLPEPLTCMFPSSLLANVDGKDVLCLASGGGQQSAVFGLLGADVTVVDLTEGQLVGDRKAAAHYGYDVTVFQADMRDLAGLVDDSFDVVFQGPSIAYVPDVREVYYEVSRVLRSGGLYRVSVGNPATTFVEWNGEAYWISQPYSQKINRRKDGAIEFRHYLTDIFNGLIDAGFSIQRVYEDLGCLQHDPNAKPGSWDHERVYVGHEFVIVAKKQ